VPELKSKKATFALLVGELEQKGAGGSSQTKNSRNQLVFGAKQAKPVLPKYDKLNVYPI